MKKNKSNQPTEKIDTLIGIGTTLKGDLEFTGGLRIDGQIVGDIVSLDDEVGTLVLSESASIAGDINVPHIVVNGNITGNVVSAQSLILQPKTKITGDIEYNKVEIQNGAVVNGKMALISEVVTDESPNLDE